MGAEACITITARGAGDLRYSPKHAAQPDVWAPYEVHPARTARTVDGVRELTYIGEWMILPPAGVTIDVGGVPLTNLVVTRQRGGRDVAIEIARGMNKAGGSELPTRIVGLNGYVEGD